MKYAAVIEYIADKAKVDAIRPAHREYLTSLVAKGQLAVSGPYMDDYGALIVYEAESMEQAEAILKADPFHSNGIFVKWVIRPWKIVLFNAPLFGI